METFITLNEIKVLKEKPIYKKLIYELKVKGLDQLYIKRIKIIDYLDVILAIINFLEKNHEILKKITQNQIENIILILIYEIFEEMKINVPEEQIEKVIKLLKNSILVKKSFEVFNRKV